MFISGKSDTMPFFMKRNRSSWTLNKLTEGLHIIQDNIKLDIYQCNTNANLLYWKNMVKYKRHINFLQGLPRLIKPLLLPAFIVSLLSQAK